MASLKKIKDAVRKTDPNLGEDDDGFRAEVVLLASLSVGPNIKKLAKFTGYERSLIAKFGKNLRDGGIWRGSKVAGGAWFEKDGGIALICDALVANGMMTRVHG